MKAIHSRGCSPDAAGHYREDSNAFVSRNSTTLLSTPIIRAFLHTLTHTHSRSTQTGPSLFKQLPLLVLADCVILPIPDSPGRQFNFPHHRNAIRITRARLLRFVRPVPFHFQSSIRNLFVVVFQIITYHHHATRAQKYQRINNLSGKHSCVSQIKNNINKRCKLFISSMCARECSEDTEEHTAFA